MLKLFCNRFKNKKIKSGIILFFSLIFGLNSSFIFANNVQISNVSLTEKNTLEQWANIRFDLIGENFWRNTDGAQNWCALWVFVKYRVNGGNWQHATLSSNSLDFVMPVGVAVDASLDGKGIFLYSDTEDIGNFDYNITDLNLRWNYGTDGVADDASNIDIRVLGIEMVYIPQASFYVGSGGGETNAFYSYPNTNTPYQINSENAIAVAPVNGNLYYSNSNITSGDHLGPIPADYPKGYNSFYLMRYEISQEQYVDFLNMLTREQQNARTYSNVAGTSVANTYVMSNSASIQNRNGIRCNASGHGTTNPITFYCDLNGNSTRNENDDGQNIACNYLSWHDGLAYLDWTGLRPMTELEFEKACRGILFPVSNEFAWGSIDITAVGLMILNSGQPNEVADNSGNGLCNFNNNIVGPLRCGYAGTNLTTNRLQAGASFYGIMELSGNLYENCISVGSPEGRNFTGIHGNGNITTAGFVDVSSWPNRRGRCLSGGGYTSSQDVLRVSNRTYRVYAYDDRLDNAGWRGARTPQ